MSEPLTSIENTEMRTKHHIMILSDLVEDSTPDSIEINFDSITKECTVVAGTRTGGSTCDLVHSVVIIDSRQDQKANARRADMRPLSPMKANRSRDREIRESSMTRIGREPSRSLTRTTSIQETSDSTFRLSNTGMSRRKPNLQPLSGEGDECIPTNRFFSKVRFIPRSKFNHAREAP